MTIVLAAIHLEPGAESVPLGAACVASALKKAFGGNGDDPGGFSVILEESILSEAPGALAEKIIRHKPDAVGFSLYLWNRSSAVKTASLIRASLRDVFLFAGGPEVTALPGGLSAAGGGPFDCLVQGEGENAAVRLFGDTLSGTAYEPLIRGETLGPEELGALPSPWLDRTLDISRYTGALWELARGCPYGCTYCYESKGEKAVRYFPEERLREELRLFGRSGVPSVFVLDPTFNTDKKRAVRLLDAILKEAPAPHWHFEVRAELLTREQAQRFAALGASLQIGLQSADPRVCAGLGRSLNRDVFQSRIGLLHEAGVSFGLDLIYGLPGDTLAGYRKSIDFALSLYPDNLDMFRLSVLPGTVLRDQAAGAGLVFSAEAPYGVISAPGFPAPDVARAEALSRAADIFYNRGRAVAWFNQVLYPLGMKPSRFLEGFSGFLEARNGEVPNDSIAVEKLQLAYLDDLYGRAKKPYLLPAVWDIVRFNGAWGRALAEGITTQIDFNYDPEELLEGGILDIEELAEFCRPCPGKKLVRPCSGGAELLDP
ncbi:B12-binding domain-containing radical SAM protein [Breznakiella homolactica]|uniref:Radical SAM protein n=1 Tax=Breznakiella homolactica TaxID=2798577 RepID=A0A7T7XQP5_9SPIR|nr:radical SAM protein [Breznakiella homolactica]QQO10726.1 radical SAM protein [Breznakiella homolactica]